MQHHASVIPEVPAAEAAGPLWRTVADAIERLVSDDGHPWRTTHLPTTEQLAQRFGVGRGTVRRALHHLAATGVVRLAFIPVDGRYRSTWVYGTDAGQAAEKSLWQEVADAIERLLSDDGHPWRTTHLPTTEQLAHQFGVSQTTVRQSLHHLAQTGLVRLVLLPVNGRHRRTWVYGTDVGQPAEKALWRTIADAIERLLLEDGHPWRTTHLPTPEQIGQQFGVSPSVVRRALHHLAQTGLVRLVLLPVNGRYRETWISAYHAAITPIRPRRYSQEQLEHTAAALLRFARPFGWTTLPGVAVLAQRLGVSQRRITATLEMLAERHQATRQRAPRRSGDGLAWRLNPRNVTPVADPVPNVRTSTLVLDHMIGRIRAGEFRYRTPDGRVHHPPLPTQQDMALRYGISRWLARKVVIELARRGLYVLEPASHGLRPRLPVDAPVVDLPDHPAGTPAAPRMPPQHTVKPVMVAEDMAARIRAGEFRAGQRLPRTKDEFAAEYGISDKTMGLALDVLVTQGWITYLRPGTGRRKIPVVVRA